MSQAKTRPTDRSVEDHLAGIADPVRRADCETLLALMHRITGRAARMWGPRIVGFGRYAYPLAGGREGESCATGFAANGRDLSIYLLAESPGRSELLSRLGRHRMGKACLSVRRLDDVDLLVLERLIAESYAEVGRRHPDSMSDATIGG